MTEEYSCSCISNEEILAMTKEDEKMKEKIFKEKTMAKLNESLKKFSSLYEINTVGVVEIKKDFYVVKIEYFN